MLTATKASAGAAPPIKPACRHGHGGSARGGGSTAAKGCPIWRHPSRPRAHAHWKPPPPVVCMLGPMRYPNTVHRHSSCPQRPHLHLDGAGLRADGEALGREQAGDVGPGAVDEGQDGEGGGTVSFAVDGPARPEDVYPHIGAGAVGHIDAGADVGDVDLQGDQLEVWTSWTWDLAMGREAGRGSVSQVPRPVQTCILNAQKAKARQRWMQPGTCGRRDAGSGTWMCREHAHRG